MFTKHAERSDFKPNTSGKRNNMAWWCVPVIPAFATWEVRSSRPAWDTGDSIKTEVGRNDGEEQII